MQTPVSSRIIAGVLTVGLMVPVDALAGFSMALAKANTKDNQEVPFPTSTCPAGVKDGDGSANTCVIKMITDAGAYCAFIAGGFVKDETWWSRARIPILLISVTGTALGVSSIAAAKSWAAVGGTSGIASGWNTDSTSVTTADDQRLSKIGTVATQLSALDPSKLSSLTTAVSVALQCRAAAGSAQSSTSNKSTGT